MIAPPASPPSAEEALRLEIERERRYGLTTFARSWFATPLAIALAIVFIVVNEVGYRMSSTITAERDQAVASRIAVGRLRGAIVSAESAQRGLLLTERPVYRESFFSALRGVGSAIDEVRAIAERRPREREPLSAIVEIGERKLSEMQETVNRVDAGQRESAMALILADIGRDQMTEIDRRVYELTTQQMSELQTTAVERDRVLLYSRYSILALVLSCLAAGLTAMRQIRHRDAERQGYLAGLRAERDKLELAVRERTHALEELAQHLQSVREDERSRLARELHDELGGLLTAAKLDLARMRSRLLQAGPEVAERVKHLNSTLDAGIALKRRIIEDLRPSSLDNLGLRPLPAQDLQRTEVPVELQLEDLRLAPELALVVYRLVQEALTNTAKYAGASRVDVVLRSEGGQAVVHVRDNGRGFLAEQRTLGHGLAGMQFRVSSTGGSFAVQSAPGEGTTITARVPLHLQPVPAVQAAA